MKKLLLLCCLLFSGFYTQAQITHIEESKKPLFNNLLAGATCFNYGLEKGQNLNFIQAYAYGQITQWMKAIRPGIVFGVKYADKSTQHIIIDVDMNYDTKLNYSGSWIWYCSDVKIIFSTGLGHFKYSFSLPDFKIRGGNLADPTLYNNMLKHITSNVISFSTIHIPHLRKTQTLYTEDSIRISYNNTSNQIEGIYESTISDEGRTKSKYKLALKYINNKAYLIYLDGCAYYDDWSVGEIKCELEPTASNSLYKGKWINLDKSINNNCYITFDESIMNIVLDGEKESYVKLYPIYNPENPISTPAINKWTGTGFALNNGCIATNYHVIEDAKSISVQGVKGDFSVKYNASIVASDKNNDIALIKINDDKFNGFGKIPYKLKATISDVGEDIFVLGYPLTSTMGEEIKLTTGVISSKTGFQGNVSLYQISAPIQHGNSGGPLFDNNGNIIGIVTASHKDTDNVGYAVKSSYLYNLIESVASTSLIPNSNLIEAKNLPEKIKAVDDFIFLIECSNDNGNDNSLSINNIHINTKENENLTINYPKCRIKSPSKIDISKVEINSQYTTIEINSNNERLDGSFAGWITLDQNAYISANNKHYRLIKTEGIEISPKKTYFSYNGQIIKFKLYFEPLPMSTTEFDLIENQDSEWKWYGIQLKKIKLW